MWESAKLYEAATKAADSFVSKADERFSSDTYDVLNVISPSVPTTGSVPSGLTPSAKPGRPASMLSALSSFAEEEEGDGYIGLAPVRIATRAVFLMPGFAMTSCSKFTRRRCCLPCRPSLMTIAEVHCLIPPAVPTPWRLSRKTLNEKEAACLRLFRNQSREGRLAFELT